MAKYTNIGTVNITVRGVTIKPGETKDLKGFANDPNLLRCTQSKQVEIKPKKVEVEHSSEVKGSKKNEPEKINQTPQVKEEPKEDQKSEGH